MDVSVASAGTRSTPALYRRSVYFFAALFAVAVVAFWPSYFAAPKHEPDYRVHFHGAVMFLWVALLCVQAFLIRGDRRAAHRALGRVAFVLVPAIIVSTLLLQQFRLKARLDAEMLYFHYVVLSLLVAFTVAFALAMANRHRPAVHGRYMVCTALALIDPIGARLLYFGLGVVPPLMQVITYGIVDVILLALILADPKREIRLRAFPLMLAVFVLSQAPTFFVSQTAAWRSFGEAFAALPLP